MTIIADIFSISSIIEIIHRVSNFLGTEQGELFKKSIEIILLVIITYMIISGFTRNKKKEYKYMSFAFTVFTIQTILSFSLLFLKIFLEKIYSPIDGFMLIIEQILGIIALILLAIAFIFPFYRGKVNDLWRGILLRLKYLIYICLIFQFIWVLILRNMFDEGYFFFPGGPLFRVMEIVIVLYTIYFILRYPKDSETYTFTIIGAFLVFMLNPILQILIFLTSETLLSARLTIISHPIPIFSLLLLTRVVYLKLADKAYLEKQLEASKAKIEAAKHVAELKDEFVSIVSHELRTPLTSIKLYLSILKSRKLGELTEKQEDAIKILNDESTRLNELINDILDLSKLEAGKVKLNIKDFDLNKYLENNPHYNLAHQHDIEVIVEVPKNTIVKVDGERFKQVFINIFSNAVKFTSLVEKERKIIIRYKDSEEYWELGIQDNGPGIAKDKLRKLFIKFYQVGEHMTRVHKGTGLGLTIVKKIIDIHKGRIKVESKIGEGTNFRVLIPKKI